MLDYIKILIVVYLFVGTNVVGYYGYKDSIFNLAMIVLSIVPMIYCYRGWYRIFIYQITLLIFIVFFIYFNWNEKSTSGLVMSFGLIGPPIMFFSLPNRKVCGKKANQDFWKFIFLVVLIAFILNSGIALIERLMGAHLFGLRGEALAYQIEDVGYTGFRSTALYGHPLKNALITSTFMSYVLMSPLKQKIKFSLWLIGYIALLCFNERASIVGNALLLFFYVGYSVFMKSKLSTSRKANYFFVTLIIAGIVYFLVTEAGLAGRLVTMGIYDENSAQVRMTIWDVFKYHQLNEFLFGHSSSYVEILSYSVGVSKIENFWLIYVFRYGLIFVFIYLIVYFFFLKKIFNQYRLFDKLFVIGTFWLLASTNNSLASGFMSLWYFLLLSVVFNPQLFPQIIDNDYLDKNEINKLRIRLRSLLTRQYK